MNRHTTPPAVRPGAAPTPPAPGCSRQNRSRPRPPVPARLRVRRTVPATAPGLRTVPTRRRCHWPAHCGHRGTCPATGSDRLDLAPVPRLDPRIQQHPTAGDEFRHARGVEHRHFAGTDDDVGGLRRRHLRGQRQPCRRPGRDPTVEHPHVFAVPPTAATTRPERRCYRPRRRTRRPCSPSLIPHRRNASCSALGSGSGCRPRRPSPTRQARSRSRSTATAPGRWSGRIQLGRQRRRRAATAHRAGRAEAPTRSARQQRAHGYRSGHRRCSPRHPRRRSVHRTDSLARSRTI